MSLWNCKDCKRFTAGSRGAPACAHCGSLNVERFRGVGAFKPVKTVVTVFPKSAFGCSRCGSPTELKLKFYGDVRQCINPECRHEEEA